MGILNSSLMQFRNNFTSSSLLGMKLALINLLRYSEQLDNELWVKADTAVEADTQVAPNGTTTADTITSNGVAYNAIYEIVTVTPGETYTYSEWVKLGTMVEDDFRTGVYDITHSLWIEQNVSHLGLSTSAWVRIANTFVVPAACTSVRICGFRKTTSVTGTVHLWGAQLRPGSAVGPYLKTE